MQRSFVEWEGKEGARPKSRIRIAVRQFDDFENALTEEIGVYSRLNPSCEVEAIPFDVECLYAKLFSKGGLKDGSWDLSSRTGSPRHPLRTRLRAISARPKQS
jgi:hypothetical protein